MAERIDALADVAVGIAERAGKLFEVAAQAKVLEPELAEAARAGRRATVELCRSFWDKAGADGLLAKGLNHERLTITTDILLCADTIVHLRKVNDWSAASYRSLIVDTLTTMSARPS